MYALVFLLVSFCLHQSPLIAQINEPQPQKDRQSRQNDAKPSPTAPKGAEAAGQNQAQTATREDIPEKRLYHRYLRATIVSAIVSLLFLFALIIQTAFTLKAVKAAERSADALVASERAWIMVTVDKAPGYGSVFDGEEIIHDILTHNTSAKVRITCKNEGRTPAWITEIVACIDVVETLSPEPDFKGCELVQNEPEYLGAGQKSEPKDTPLARNKGREIGKMTIVYGVVKYRNVFSNTDAATTFGYKIRDDGTFERLSSPRSYNTNT